MQAASKYFTDLLGPNVQESKPKEFNLKDADGSTIKIVVKFCYTGHIDLTQENAEKILRIASNVEIDLLEEKCRQFFFTELSVANAVNTLCVANEYRFGDLRDQAFLLVCENFGMLSTVDVYKLSHPLLKELLECDKVQETGDLCAKRLLEWFQNDEDERGVHMPELLKMIPLELVTVEVCFDNVSIEFTAIFSDVLIASPFSICRF